MFGMAACARCDALIATMSASSPTARKDTARCAVHDEPCGRQIKTWDEANFVDTFLLRCNDAKLVLKVVCDNMRDCYTDDAGEQAECQRVTPK